jgi:hypothetical protein
MTALTSLNPQELSRVSHRGSPQGSRAEWPASLREFLEDAAELSLPRWPDEATSEPEADADDVICGSVDDTSLWQRTLASGMSRKKWGEVDAMVGGCTSVQVESSWPVAEKWIFHHVKVIAWL